MDGCPGIELVSALICQLLLLQTSVQDGEGAYMPGGTAR